MAKAYFNSFDYFAANLAAACKESPGRRNHFLVLLTLAGKRDLPDISPPDLFSRDALEFLYGKMGRNPWTLAPYFKRRKHVPERPETREIELSSEKELPAALENYANQFSPHPVEQILFRTPETRRLAFKFDHRFFDGRGAELLIDAWMRGDTSEMDPHGSFLRSPHLTDWKNQFVCGHQVQRKEIEFRRLPGGVAHFKTASTAANRFRILEFSARETAALAARIESEAGPFMSMIFLLAISAKHLVALLERLGTSGNLVFPTTTDLRGQEDLPPRAVFGNPWSILPLKLLRADASSLKRSIPVLRAELFQMVAARLPQAYRHAGYLARIAPFWLLNRISKKCFQATSGTSMFSFLPETSLQQETFSAPADSGISVVNVQHLPVMPPEPGLGFFFNLYRGKLNCTVSCREGLMPDAELETLSASLEADLKGALK